MKRDNIAVNDRQLACARIASEEGQDYMKVSMDSIQYNISTISGILSLKTVV